VGSTRELFERFTELLTLRDKAGLEQMFHRDFTADSPQSGERSRGFEQFWAQIEQYPGGVPDGPLLPDARIIGDDERWVISPSYTVVPLRSPNEFTLLYRDLYPDGVLWYVVMLVELRDGLIKRVEIYFAPELAVPLAESIANYARG
jgi:hypothetical protein